MICSKCKRDLSLPKLSPARRAKELRDHEGSRGCTLDSVAQELFVRDLVPYPKGHSLPDFIPIQVYKTRAETGLDKLGQLMPKRSSSFEDQYWAPKWARIVTEQVSRGYANTVPEIVIGARNRYLKRLLDDEEAQRVLLTAFALGGFQATRPYVVEGLKVGVERWDYGFFNI